MSLNESIVEDAAFEWFGELGYSWLGAEALAPTLSPADRGEGGFSREPGNDVQSLATLGKAAAAVRG